MSRVTTIGLSRDGRHNYYANYADKKAGPLPGVTGVIGIMDKPAVAYWRGKTVAEIIAKDVDFYAKLIATGGVDAAVGWAAKLPGYERDKAADVGTIVHIVVDKLIHGHEVDVPVDQLAYVQAFHRFLEERKPTIVSSEQLVCGWDYGGTFDFLTKEADGSYAIYDVKTWKHRPVPGGDMYAETAMQLAAYANAHFIGAPGDPKRHRMPKITGHYVLHLRPDAYDSGYQVYPFHVTDADYEAFRGLLTAYRWKQTRAKVVIGEPHTQLTEQEKVA